MRRSAGSAGLEAGGRPGRQQRAAALREAAAAEPSILGGAVGGRSHYVSFLLEEWAWGHLSAPALQRHAATSYADQVALLHRVGASPDFVDQGLNNFAKLGGWGRFENHIHQDILRYLGSPSYPPPVLVDVPVLKQKHGTPDTIKLPIFLPHILFAWSYKHNKKAFNMCFWAKWTLRPEPASGKNSGAEAIRES